MLLKSLVAVGSESVVDREDTDLPHVTLCCGENEMDEEKLGSSLKEREPVRDSEEVTDCSWVFVVESVELSSKLRVNDSEDVTVSEGLVSNEKETDRERDASNV